MPDKLIFRAENEEDFWRYWQDYIKKNKISPKYLRTYIEPLFIISKENGLLFTDKSFVLLENNEPVACVFLPIEKDNKESEIKNIKIEADGDFVLAPLTGGEKRVQKKIFEIIEDIAKKEQVARAMFSIDPLEKDTYGFNYLQKYGYLDASILVYFINTKPDSNLLENCREGCRKLIRPLLKNSDYEIFYTDKNAPDLKMHKSYENLHHKCAGRLTRPQWTFDNQFEELKNGNAILFGLKYKGKEVAFCYFSYNGEKAIYSSGADDPEYDHLPLYHVLVFSAAEHFQQNGIKFIDVGQPSSPSTQFCFYPDEKQTNISLFKRGFGGDFVNNFRGVKYFLKEAFEKDINKFLGEYAKKI